jgi:hypothetical protein
MASLSTTRHRAVRLANTAACSVHTATEAAAATSITMAFSCVAARLCVLALPECSDQACLGAEVMTAARRRLDRIIS